MVHHKIRKVPIEYLGEFEFRTVVPWKKSRQMTLIFNELKKLYYDSKSGEGGDIFTFIANLNGLTTKKEDGFQKTLIIAKKILSKDKKRRGRK